MVIFVCLSNEPAKITQLLIFGSQGNNPCNTRADYSFFLD
jgi:hypothetical protein